MIESVELQSSAVVRIYDAVDMKWYIFVGIGIYEDLLLGSCMWNVGVRSDWNTV